MFTSPDASNYRFVFLRHAESVGNANGYHQGQSDFPLTPRGREQAQALAARWLAEKRSFDAIVASPLSRTRETAAIVAASLSLSCEFDDDWKERHVGLLSGMRPEDAQKLYPRPAFMNLYQPVGETGESQWDLYLRAGRAIQTLLRRSPGQYLVVSHGGILNMVLYVILGITPQANFIGPRFRFRNASFCEFTYSPREHAWRMLTLNDRRHWLGEDGD